MLKIIKGNIIETTALNDFQIHENSYIIAENGVVVGIFSSLPEKYINEKIEDYSDCLLLQGFADMHLHAPQYPMLGMGMDLPLIDWLNKYTFPQEANFSDIKYARKVYSKLAQDLIKNGTTRIAIFSSLHLEASLVLMEELEKQGIQGYVGKVNMDRNSPSFLVEETQKSIDDTLLFIEKSKKFKHLYPIITPRFTPSCTDKLMENLGKIARQYNLKIQSHLSENVNEIKWVKELSKDADEYYQTYEKYGLWNKNTLMAHCVHSDEKELNSIKDNGVYVVHCPSSNIDLISGFAQIRIMLNKEIKVVLGSDVAGGSSLSMFDAMKDAILVSKNVCIEKGTMDFLTPEESYYLATSASAEFFNEEKGIKKGNQLNIVVLDDSCLLDTEKLTLKERFERSIYLRQINAIKAVFIGEKEHHF